MNKTIKELAKELNCSYEAIRQHTKRYRIELNGHILQQGKTQYLDEFACDFIRGKRLENPVTVQTIERDEALEELRQKYTRLLEESRALEKEYRQYVADSTQLLQTASRQVALAEQAESLEAKNAVLSAERDEAREKTLEAEKTAEKANMELQEALQEIKKMKNATFWQRLRGFK